MALIVKGPLPANTVRGTEVLRGPEPFEPGAVAHAAADVVQVIDARGHRLRHVAPGAGEGATVTLLGRTYGFVELPVSALPTSPDFVEGTYTHRLGDAGEFSVTFPNTAGAKGLWRERFSTDKALEFLEVYRDDVLEFVGSIQRIEIDDGSVTVSGSDAWALLRRAYERDRIWTAAPRDVIEAYTRVPVALMTDQFAGSSLGGGWSKTQPQFTLNTPVDDGLVTLSPAGNITQDHYIRYDLNDDFGDDWRVTARIVRGSFCRLLVFNSANAIVAYISAGGGDPLARGTFATRDDSANEVGVGTVATWGPAPWTFTIVRQGRWAAGYVNGVLIGWLPWLSAGGGEQVGLGLISTPPVPPAIDDIWVVRQQSFLERGADAGDFHLPGDYPTGGLRGRYFNHADLEGLTAAIRHARLMSPDREPYGERLDPVVDTTGSSAGTLSLPLQPGSSGDYFSVRWFGAVYLRGDLGDYTFETTSVDDGVRLWVGKTAWGEQIIDDWTSGAGTNTGVWDASDHGSAAGWYPIVLEYFEDGGGNTIRLQFTPPASTYTDPGGTSITASTKRVIPSTSLSPLGCFDNRVQGTSHFDMVAQVAQQFGYQLWCEPMQLESGEFPGRLVPRERVGRDTDVLLQPDETDRDEPIFAPGVTYDASDQAVHLIGSGAGAADGRSQTRSEITDLAEVQSGLFALESWVDAGDIAFTDLLAARLNAELALRGEPWEEVRGTPRAQERLADTWPLSGALSAMRWRPGDGIRLLVPNIGVRDTEPRQLMQVTRTFGAHGRTGTQVGIRQRPRSAARSLRSLVRASLVRGRSDQGRVVTLSGNYVQTTLAAGGFTDYSIAPLLPGDRVVRAVVRITLNSAGMSLNLEINGTGVSSALGGPWSTAPVEVDVTGYAVQASTTDSRLYARMENGGGSTTNHNFQLIVEVQR